MTVGADTYRPERGGLSPEQAAHERLIEATAESLGKATAKGEQHRLQAELYRQIRERDETVRDDLEDARMERAGARTW
jgi:hypothetical protein